MPNTQSAKKRLRQDEARKKHNLSIKRAMRTQIHKVRDALKAGNVELATAEFRVAARKLDRAGSRNIIHRNAAARLKSRLSAQIKASQQK